MTASWASEAFSAFSAEFELRLGAIERIDRVVALGVGRDALLLQSHRPLERFLGLPDANLGITDLGAHLGDVGLGLGAARLDLRELRVEHGTIENGEHIALLHQVALVGVERDHRQAIEVGADRGLFAGDDRAVDRQRLDELAPLGGDYPDRRRHLLDDGRGFACGKGRGRHAAEHGGGEKGGRSTH